MHTVMQLQTLCKLNNNARMCIGHYVLHNRFVPTQRKVYIDCYCSASCMRSILAVSKTAGVAPPPLLSKPSRFVFETTANLLNEALLIKSAS